MATHIIIVIMGAVLSFIILQMLAKYKPLSKGETVTGTVEGFEVQNKKNTTISIPVIGFTTRQEQQVLKLSEDSVLSTRIAKGTKVKVFYDPANPEHFIAQGKYFKTYSRTVLIASVIFTLAGLVLILNDLGIIHLFKK